MEAVRKNFIVRTQFVNRNRPNASPNADSVLCIHCNMAHNVVAQILSRWFQHSDGLIGTFRLICARLRNLGGEKEGQPHRPANYGPPEVACMIGKICNFLVAKSKTMASEYRCRFIQFHYPAIKIGKAVLIDRGVYIRALDGGNIHIGQNTHIWRNSIIEARGGNLHIGANGLVNAGCYLLATSKIEIGENALIAEYVTIRDQDHAHERSGQPYAQQGRVEAPIIIGDNVWIGAKSTITKGVTIEAGSIVGANSVVTKDLAGSWKYAGAPAKPIKTRTP